MKVLKFLWCWFTMILWLPWEIVSMFMAILVLLLESI